MIDDLALAQLTELLGDRLQTADAVRDQHARDESSLPPAAPDAVAFPIDVEEVSLIARCCSEHAIPLVPFGAGTSLEGHVLATSGGLSVDMTHMDRILEVNVDDLDVTVQSGVTRLALEKTLAGDGLFFPVDPGADATIGGMVATGAAGTTTVRYGAMRENVLGLDVVLADGRVVRTGHRARKTSAGYDLTRLFIGSEGTLGIVTAVTLKVYGIPEAISGAVCSFPTTEDAIRSVVQILQFGIPVARVEFMNEDAVAASNSFSDLDRVVAPTLLIEFHGSLRSVEDQTQRVGEVVSECGATDYRHSLDTQERLELWKARHTSFYASLALRPGAKAVTTDVCVPLSHLGDSMVAARRDAEEAGLVTTIVGHVGDGNFHVVILVDPEDEAEIAAADAFNQRLVKRALDVDGTCTGEHGIGLRKRAFLRSEFPEAVEVMAQIKRTLDPRGIMNPGKILDPAFSQDLPLVRNTSKG